MAQILRYLHTKDATIGCRYNKIKGIQNMQQSTTSTGMTSNQSGRDAGDLAPLLLGTGFALASLIFIPALSQRLGLGSSVTSALRVALMKASNKV